MTAVATIDAAERVEQHLFAVPGMRCASCIARLEDGLSPHAGILAARVNFTAKQVSIDHLPGLSVPDLKAMIARLGFEAEPIRTVAALASQDESRCLAKATAVAGFAAMNVMLLSVSVWSGADGATRDIFHLLSAMIAIPTVAYSGRPFFKSAWAALRSGRTNMDVPITIGVLLVTALSLYEALTSRTPIVIGTSMLVRPERSAAQADLKNGRPE